MRLNVFCVHANFGVGIILVLWMVIFPFQHATQWALIVDCFDGKRKRQKNQKERGRLEARKIVIIVKLCCQVVSVLCCLSLRLIERI